jgi:hypothetical protein
MTLRDIDPEFLVRTFGFNRRALLRTMLSSLEL